MPSGHAGCREAPFRAGVLFVGLDVVSVGRSVDMTTTVLAWCGSENGGGTRAANCLHPGGSRKERGPEVERLGGSVESDANCVVSCRIVSRQRRW